MTKLLPRKTNLVINITLVFHRYKYHYEPYHHWYRYVPHHCSKTRATICIRYLRLCPNHFSSQKWKHTIPCKWPKRTFLVVRDVFWDSSRYVLPNPKHTLGSVLPLFRVFGSKVCFCQNDHTKTRYISFLMIDDTDPN
jgi:hypothetical protein